MGLEMPRVEFDGLLERGDGPRQVLADSQRVSQVVVGRGELRVEFDRLLQRGDGPRRVSLKKQDAAQVGVSRGVASGRVRWPS